MTFWHTYDYDPLSKYLHRHPDKSGRIEVEVNEISKLKFMGMRPSGPKIQIIFQGVKGWIKYQEIHTAVSVESIVFFTYTYVPYIWYTQRV